MKNIFVLLILFIFSQSVFAKAIPVEALSDFSTENPPVVYSVKILDNIDLSPTLSLKEGNIVEGKIVDVISPRRLKRNATFTFIPEKIENSAGSLTEIKGYYPAKYTTKLNKGQIAKSAALGVGSYFIKGLSIGYSAVEGAVKNEKDNRFKSSVNSVYENSPLSYVEKGEELVIKKGQFFLLNFKIEDDENLPNYEYEELPTD